MCNIVVNICPFSLYSKIYVYRDGDIIEELETTIDDLNRNIGAAQAKFSATEINLIGNQDYLNHFKALINTQFSEKNVNINIISQ